ncbi:XTP/dITP diphosphatase [Candidatus Bathyarchaeota archaeon]|nr:XTP/dITP diphosphatase [Candidatus Bathyarchaeota archaeon]
MRASPFKGSRIRFATTNKGKLREISILLGEYNLEVEAVEAEKVEIQSDDISRIAEYAALDLAGRLGYPVAVEDSGLHIPALNGFPGPYSSYIYRSIGLRGVLKLLEGVEDRRGFFESVVAYAEPKGMVKCFRGVVWGRISLDARGTGGFGFDPIFIPEEGDGRTFAEMTLEEKNRISHRGRALRSFGEWITSSPV